MARTILLVDDEPTILETVGGDLEREGFRVLRAEDGSRALALFRQERPDIVVLDLMLPELSGTEVCRIIRRESAVPILILSAKDAELDKIILLELGADDYVTKPFSLRELRARLTALLRRADRPGRDEGPPGLVEVGRVQVDLAGHRLLRGGEPVPVKPKVFELLAFLIANAGQVMRREQLLELVWGYDYAGETRTVDVHVHALRREIEPDPARPTCLQTVRGVGYVLRRPT
jgi:DNA-binding response OmpR family regulator